MTQGLYPPGSTFKIITGAAALESGVDPNAKVRVDDPWQADKSWGSYFVRSSSRAHGDYTMADGYRLSENIYFAKIGLQIGGPKLAEYAQRFGIGSSTHCDITAAKGQLSIAGVLDRPTLVADTAYGQGELLVSPLQMALAAAAVGMGGVMPTPHYATEVRDAAGHAIRVIAPGPIGQVIRPETARTLTTMLVGAVSGPGAFAFAAKIPGVNVAGKTGEPVGRAARLVRGLRAGRGADRRRRDPAGELAAGRRGRRAARRARHASRTRQVAGNSAGPPAVIGRPPPPSSAWRVAAPTPQ